MSQSSSISDSSVEESGAECTNCGTTQSWGESPICPNCGYYPQLKIVVELDSDDLPTALKNDSGEDEDPSASDPETVETPPPVAETPESEEDISGEDPTYTESVVWSWKGTLLRGCVVIVGVDFLIWQNLVRFHVLLSAVLQLVLGLAIVGFSHWTAVMFAVRRSPGSDWTQLIARPLKAWLPTLDTLPASRRRIWIGTWGITNVIGSLALILVETGQANAMYDWSLAQLARSEASLRSMFTVSEPSAKNADPEEGETDTGDDTATATKDDPEEVIDDVGNEPDVTDSGVAETTQDPPNDSIMLPGETDPDFMTRLESQLRSDPTYLIALPTVDCLIVGYTMTSRNDLALLILASVVDDRLVLVGRMPASSIPSEIREEIRNRVRGIYRGTPLVPTEEEAIWIEPRLMCRVAYQGRRLNGELLLPLFRAQLPDLVDEEINDLNVQR